MSVIMKPYSLKEAKKKIRQLKSCIEDRCQLHRQIKVLEKFRDELSEESYYPFFQNCHQIILFDIFFDSPEKVFSSWVLDDHDGYIVITNDSWRKGLKHNIKRLLDIGMIVRKNPGLFQLAPAFKALRKKCRIEEPTEDG